MEVFRSIILKDRPDLVQVQMYTEDNKQITKLVTLEQYKALLNGATEREKSFRLGRLPEGFYDARVASKNTFKAVAVLPKGRHDTFFYDEPVSLPYPALVFVVEATKGANKDFKVFALAEDTPNDDSVLYHFPYSNVYDDGHVCMGGNKRPDITSLLDVNAYMSFFIGTPMNRDLWKAPKSFKKEMDCREFIEHCSKLEQFPTDYLNPSKGAKRLGLILKGDD